MWKALAAGTLVLAIAGSSLVYAQQRQSAPDADGKPLARSDAGPRGRMTAEDATAFSDARIAALKAGLKLTPEQEKHWPAVESAIRDLAKQRFERRSEMRERMRERREGNAAFDPIDGMRRRADAMASGAAGLKRLADAADPLYKTLDDGQKRRLLALARNMRPGGEGRHGWRHGGRHGGRHGWTSRRAGLRAQPLIHRSPLARERFPDIAPARKPPAPPGGFFVPARRSRIAARPVGESGTPPPRMPAICGRLLDRPAPLC